MHGDLDRGAVAGGVDGAAAAAAAVARGVDHDRGCRRRAGARSSAAVRLARGRGLAAGRRLCRVKAAVATCRRLAGGGKAGVDRRVEHHAAVALVGAALVRVGVDQDVVEERIVLAVGRLGRKYGDQASAWAPIPPSRRRCSRRGR